MPAPRKAIAVHESAERSERKQRLVILKLRRIRKAFAERMLPAVERMLEASKELQKLRRSMHRKCARVGGARCIHEFDMAFDETIEEQNDREANEILGVGFADVVQLGRDLKRDMEELKGAVVAPELPSEAYDAVKPREAEGEAFSDVGDCSSGESESESDSDATEKAPEDDGGSGSETEVDEAPADVVIIVDDD